MPEHTEETDASYLLHTLLSARLKILYGMIGILFVGAGYLGIHMVTPSSEFADLHKADSIQRAQEISTVDRVYQLEQSRDSIMQMVKILLSAQCIDRTPRELELMQLKCDPVLRGTVSHRTKP